VRHADGRVELSVIRVRGEAGCVREDGREALDEPRDVGMAAGDGEGRWLGDGECADQLGPASGDEQGQHAAVGLADEVDRSRDQGGEFRRFLGEVVPKGARGLSP
jgi:hypothetical protein